MLGQSQLVADKTGLAGLITDDTIADAPARVQRVPVVDGSAPDPQAERRADSRHAFYSQCYPAGLFALLLGLGSIATQLLWPLIQLAGVVPIVMALLWYGSLQTRWFARELGISLLRGFGIATVGMIECVIAIVLIAPLLA